MRHAKMTRTRAIELLMAFALNYFLEILREAIERVIGKAKDVEDLSWLRYSDIIIKIRAEMERKIDSHPYSQAGNDTEANDEYLAARWMLGREFVEARISDLIRAVNNCTIELLMYRAIDERRAELQKEADERKQEQIKEIVESLGI